MVKFLRRLAAVVAVACMFCAPVSATTTETETESTTPRATFTNAEPTTPDLYVKKIVESSDERYPADEDTEFTFILKLNGELAKNVQYTVIGEDGNEIKNTSSGVTVPYKTDSNGQFTLKAGQSAKFTYVGEGVSYEVTEGTMPDGFTQVSPAGSAVGTVEEDGSFVEFTNRYTPPTTPTTPVTPETDPDTGETEVTTAKLRIEKQISFPKGYKYDTDTEFGFTVTVDGAVLSNTAYDILDADTSEVTGNGTTDDNGHFTIHAGEAARLTVPTDVDYLVTEDESDSWTAYGGSSKSGAVTYPVTDILFTNIQAAFAVSKSTDTETDDTFTFLLLDGDNKAISAQPYYLYNEDGEREDDETYETDTDGKFTLKSGQTAMFIKMDVGTSYQVQEEQSDGWKQVLPVTADGYTDKTVSASVEVLPFVNNEDIPESGTITVRKNVESASGQMPDTSAEFTFVLTKLADGSYEPVADVTYSISSGKSTSTYQTDAEGRFTVKANQAAVFEGLDLGVTYRVVEELEDPSYTIGDAEKSQEAELTDTLSFTFTNTYEPVGFLTLTKADASDTTKALDGAVFGIYSADTCADTEKVSEMTTGTDGVATSKALPLGTYYVKELTPPAGYVSEGTVYPVTLSVKGETVKVSENPITNTFASGSIKIVKYDADGKTTLSGVTFSLKDEDGTTTTATTGTNGEALFNGLEPGTYEITETKTAAGHTLLAEPITATIPLAMTEAEVEAQGNVDVSQAVHDEAAGIYYFYNLTYHVTNSASLQMPTSGAGGFPWQAMAAGIAAILAAYAVIYKKRKHA